MLFIKCYKTSSFNRIDLPPYNDYKLLKQKLLLAISEGIGGFSLV